MIISEKQIYELMNLARFITMNHVNSHTIKEKAIQLIYEIENQQSDELKVIE